MNCQKCGSPLVPGDKFCNTCGTQVIQDQPVMNQMPTGMNMGMNNTMGAPMNNQQPEVATQQHPLMMNQNDLNMNAMSTPAQPMNTMPQDNSMNMGTNTFMPTDNGMGMNTQPMDNSMNMGMNTQPLDNSMNMGMNTMGMGMDNQIPQPMSAPSAMNMGTGPMGATTPNQGNSKLVLAGVVLAVVILIGIFIFIGNGNSLGGKEVGKGGEVEKDVPTYTVKVSGFSFKVPQTYIYEVSNGYLLLTDETDSWILRLSVQKMSYESLKTNMEQLKPTAEKKGYKAEEAEVKTFSGVELIKFNFEASGMKYNGGYAKINSMYLATIEGFNQDNTYDEDLLKKAAAIIKTAEYTGDTANMEIAIPDAALSLIQQ